MRFDKNELVRLYKDYRGDSYSKIRSLYEKNYNNKNNYLNKKITLLKEVED